MFIINRICKGLDNQLFHGKALGKKQEIFIIHYCKLVTSGFI